MPKIANAIAKLLERKPGMTRTMLVTELAAIAQSDILQYLELVEGRLIVKDPATLPEEALSAIRSMGEHITERAKGAEPGGIRYHGHVGKLSSRWRGGPKQVQRRAKR